MNFLSWLKKGSLAVIDQGLFSGANFIVNILLARWLTPEEYGAFAVAMSVFYLLAGFHTAVLTEPMMVFGAGKYRESFRKYLGMLLYGHWGIAAIISLALGVAALVTSHYGSKVLSHALAGLAIASPFLLLFWLARRACYVPMRPVWAVIGSAMNLVIVVAGVFLLWRASLLSGFSGLVLLGVAAGVASLVALAPVRPQVAGFAGNPTVGMVISDHQGYGVWIVAEGLAYSTFAQLWIILVPAFLGFRGSAAILAVLNMYKPAYLLMQSVALILLPSFVRLSKNSTPQAFYKKVSHLGITLGIVMLLYATTITVSGKKLLHLFYAGKYDEHVSLAAILGITLVVAALTQIAILALKSHNRITGLMYVWGVATLGALGTSIPLMMMFGVNGAALGYLLGYTLACWTVYHQLRMIKNDKTTAETPPTV